MHRKRFCPLAVQKHSFGTKKTLSASEINRFYFLAVSFAQETFLPTRSAKAQLRDKENAFCIRNKTFLFFSGFFCTGNVFLPTRSNLLQLRYKENDHIIKSFLLFVQREAFEVTFALSLLIKKGRTSVQPFWLGWPDSNQRMQQSKCCVLPLDDTPIFIEFKKSLQNLQTLWGG